MSFRKCCSLVYSILVIDIDITLIMLAIAAIVGLLIIWPSLAIQVKRWHDRDKSGWWVLIGLIAVIGGIWVLVECGFLPGTAGTNRFGPPPA